MRVSTYHVLQVNISTTPQQPHNAVALGGLPGSPRESHAVNPSFISSQLSYPPTQLALPRTGQLQRFMMTLAAAVYSLVKYPVSEVLRVAQLVKKCSDFYHTRRFITVFLADRHWSLFWSHWKLVGFQVLTAKCGKMAVCWNAAPCSPVDTAPDLPQCMVQHFRRHTFVCIKSRG
jgi:hypothetical protein